jgi:hypothetical protein
MPNRKTFDEREKYDHSGRALNHREGNDLKPDVREDGEFNRGASPEGAPERRALRAPRSTSARTKAGG